jgi:epoxyqueuosine reductase
VSRDLSAWLQVRARELGFRAAGICRPEPSPAAASRFRVWLAAGMHGGMGYMARPDRVARTLHPERSLDGASSLLVVALAYDPPPADALPPEPARGRIAAYAGGPDYHDVMLPRLRALGAEIAGRPGPPTVARPFVDTGPLLERDAAARAGLGFIGRNTMLTRPGTGSFLLLGALLVAGAGPAEDRQTADQCGGCTRCIEACPTGALVAPGVLEARRCVSYLTIENRGPILRELRAPMGNWVFGCDICALVCPYNGPARRRAQAAEAAGDEGPQLADLAVLDEVAFRERFGGTPVMRARRAGLVRNACVALGNWGSPDAFEPLEAALADTEPLVRGHAAWGLGRLGTASAGRALERARSTEDHPWVAEELRQATMGQRART